MNRLLFVDDEPHVLAGLERLLAFGGEWEVRTALGGQAALECLREEPADIVISDLRMPGMDGAELLRRVQSLYPRTVRIILSGETDDDGARRAVPVTHQFLTKPCDTAVLLGVLDQVRDLRTLLSDERLQLLVGSVRTLPARPTVYLALTEALQDPDVSTATVAGIVERDPSIASKVLHLSNSAFFGQHHHTIELSAAVSHIGYTLLHSMVAACEVFGALGGDTATGEADAVDAHLCARLARTIGWRTGNDVAFTAALLRDLGVLILDRRETVDGAPPLAPAPGPHADRHLREQEYFGFDHAQIGAYLLAAWGLPAPLVRGVLYHHAPQAEPAQQLTTAGVVYLAENMLRDLEPADAEALTAFAISRGVGEYMEDWRDEAREMRDAAAVPGDKAA